MSYPDLPDRRMPYHRDGSVLAYSVNSGISSADAANLGISAYLSNADLIELNDGDYTDLSVSITVSGTGYRCIWAFFPEQREVTAHYFGASNGALAYNTTNLGIDFIEGSTNTTNGVDGTWETASLPDGRGHSGPSLDGWRRFIKPVSFTGSKKAVRLTFRDAVTNTNFHLVTLHIYGEKAAGQTPDDLIFINHQDTPGVEYATPQDFGDRPLGTTVTHTFRVKNDSPTKTANSVNLQCNDSDFAISTDGVTYVTTINIASLAPGAESATLWIRDTTPAPGALLGPRFAEIVAVVGSWT